MMRIIRMDHRVAAEPGPDKDQISMTLGERS
jgi:hypothetical protein